MDHKEQERMVKELEIAIERLQALYNQYFMGIEKLEPIIPKKAVERKFNELRKIKFYNTALRFRFQSQVQKYSTHMTHWRRICRQIEEGTYKRDLMRAKARTERQEQPPQRPGENDSQDTTAQEDDGLPVFDLEAMFDEVEDAFEQGFDLAAQMNAITVPPPRPAPSYGPKDVVEPVGMSASQNAPAQRTSGVPIPVSSLKASRKTDEARFKASRMAPSPTTGSSRFRAAPTPPPQNATAAPSAATAPPQKAAAPPQQATPPKKSPAPKPAAPAAAGGSNIDDKKIQSIYRAYVSARTKTNEGTDNINLQKITNVLRKTEKQKGGVSDFKVVIRNGKAVIKAIK